MTGYISGIIGVSILVGIIDIICPDGGGFKKYLRLVSGLVVAVMILSPMGSFLSYFSTSFWGELDGMIYEESLREEYQDKLYESLESASRESIEENIEKILYERFNIEQGNADASAVLERGDGDIKVKKLTLTLRGVAIFKDPYEIEEYFASLLHCECVTVIE